MTRPSFRVDGSSERCGIALNVPLPSLTSTATHSGKPRDSAASRAALQRREARAIDQNAVMANDLTRFGTRGTEAHAVCNGVKAGFEQLQQVFASLALT